MNYFLNKSLLNEVCSNAQSSPRLRKNHNLHATETHACQRLFNAMQPGSYIRPHRHQAQDKDETLLMVQGKLGIVLFSETGAIEQIALASSGGAVDTDTFGYHLPAGIFHTVIALTPNTVFFEAKAGPYTPTKPEEFASWAPAEGTPEAAAYLQRLEALFASDNSAGQA